MRVLVGGVGYRNLRDHSFGVLVTDALSIELAGDPVSSSPPVVVEDISYNPIAVVQRLEDERPPFDRLLLVAAAKRPGRKPGVLTVYRWDNAMPDAEHVQSAVAQAVTGVISLDNTMLVARQFGALPDDVIVIEVEPEDEQFGEEMSAGVSAAFEQACGMARWIVSEPGAGARIPLAPLGGGWPRTFDSLEGTPDGIARSW